MLGRARGAALGGAIAAFALAAVSTNCGGGSGGGVGLEVRDFGVTVP